MTEVTFEPIAPISKPDAELLPVFCHRCKRSSNRTFTVAQLRSFGWVTIDRRFVTCPICAGLLKEMLKPTTYRGVDVSYVKVDLAMSPSSKESTDKTVTNIVPVFPKAKPEEVIGYTQCYRCKGAIPNPITVGSMRMYGWATINGSEIACPQCARILKHSFEEDSLAAEQERRAAALRTDTDYSDGKPTIAYAAKAAASQIGKKYPAGQLRGAVAASEEEKKLMGSWSDVFPATKEFYKPTTYGFTSSKETSGPLGTPTTGLNKIKGIGISEQKGIMLMVDDMSEPP